MDQRDQVLKHRVMSRIYMIYGIRLLVHPRLLKALIVALFFWRSTAYVSYAQVFANAPSWGDIPHGLAFFAEALRQTEMTTIVLLFGITVFGVWLALDLVRKTNQEPIF